MITATLALVALLGQQPAAAPAPEIPVLRAGLGSCATNFTVRTSDGTPAYAAMIHVKVRYGFMHLRRMDLEISTNSDGKAVIEGLPGKARPLAYDIQKSDQKAAVVQDVSKECQAAFDVGLK